MERDGEVRPLKVLRTFTVPKREDAPNEDRFRFSDDGRICVVCDGASVSYDPGPWADVLSRRFIENPDVSLEWLDASIIEYTSGYDRETLPWMQQAAFDRGSFATLLGVAFSEDWRAARVTAIGDTILAFVDEGQVVCTIPYRSAEEFERAPDLLSSNRAENRALDISSISRELHIASHDMPTILLMTDAVGRWLLDQPDSSRIATLLSLNDDDAFTNFVEQERAEGRLRRDDSTLLVIG